MGQLDRLARKEEAALDGLDLGELDEERVRDVEQQLERIRTWCAAVERAIAARAASEGGTGGDRGTKTPEERCEAVGE